MPGSAIQRRAPLISTPTTNVAAVSISAMVHPRIASRFTSRGESSETAVTMAPASARNTICLMIRALRASPIRSATDGLEASTMM